VAANSGASQQSLGSRRLGTLYNRPFFGAPAFTDVFGVPLMTYPENCTLPRLLSRKEENPASCNAPSLERRDFGQAAEMPAEQSPCQAPSRDRSWPRSAPGRAMWLFWQRPRRCVGVPSVLPLAFAFLMPARTRSQIRLRSSSATAPRTVKTILPVGVLVSTCSERETKSIPRALKVSSALSR
jgi:hypothetical protein